MIWILAVQPSQPQRGLSHRAPHTKGIFWGRRIEAALGWVVGFSQPIDQCDTGKVPASLPLDGRFPDVAAILA